MRLLLDTQLLLWTAEALPQADRVRPYLEADGAISMFSIASLWEITIKRALNKPNFQIDPVQLRLLALKAGYEELPILTDHVLGVGRLPPIHRDPFDRLLVSQATAEGIQLLTADKTLAKYPGPIRRV